jgi:hypothetical protein
MFVGVANVVLSVVHVHGSKLAAATRVSWAEPHLAWLLLAALRLQLPAALTN